MTLLYVTLRYPVNCHASFRLYEQYDLRRMRFIIRPLGYERVYLPLSKVADTPFHIQRDKLYDIPGTGSQEVQQVMRNYSTRSTNKVFSI